MDHLPTEILLNIFTQLNIDALIKMRRICRRFKQIVDERLISPCGPLGKILMTNHSVCNIHNSAGHPNQQSCSVCKLKKPFFSNNEGLISKGTETDCVHLPHPVLKGRMSIIVIDAGASKEDIAYRHNLFLFVIAGSGLFTFEGNRVMLIPSSSATVAKGTTFSYANTGDVPLVMLVRKIKHDF